MAQSKREAELREKVVAECAPKPGVYRFYCQDEVIYVGRSKSVRSRLLSYFRAAHGDKAQKIVSVSTRVDWEYTPSEFESHLTELYLIKKERPHFNRVMNYDLEYVFVGVGTGIAPRLLISTEPIGFGPFRSSRIVEEAVRRLSDVLQLRTSEDNIALFEQPQPALSPRCLRGQIGLCVAPCAGRAVLSEYQERLALAQKFLAGKKTTLFIELQQKMREAAGKLEFERAAVFRDRAAALEGLLQTLLTQRDSLRWLTFVYEVPNKETKKTLFFIHGGRVLGKAAPYETARIKELSALLQKKAPPPKNATEMDEIRVLANWFHAHPEEKQHTQRIDVFLQSL
jgi:excinuclease ABC subunit C